MKIMGNRLRDISEGIGGAFLIGVALVPPFLRSWRRWGATDAEVGRALPGDEFVPHPKGGFTQAITIHSPRHRVWPWVAQIGQGRGGFYSYDFLENLIGCNIHSVDEIVTAYQHDERSEGLRLHPNMLPVPFAKIDSGKTLLFGGKWYQDAPVSWVLLLDEVNENTTRLIIRWVFDFKPGLGNSMRYKAFIEPISLVMGRKMLLGIRKRVEAADDTTKRVGSDRLLNIH
jgi:hypothetical protein